MPKPRAWIACLVGLGLPLVLPSGAEARRQLFGLRHIRQQVARAQHLYSLEVRYAVKDPACFEGIDFSLDRAPAGMRVSEKGWISWIPLASEAVQTFEVVVRARGRRAVRPPCNGRSEERTGRFEIMARPGTDVLVGSFSALVYNTYLLNPEGPFAEAPDNDCRGFHIGAALRDLDYDIVALAETFDDKGREGLWDQVNSYCVPDGDAADDPSGTNTQCLYPAWVMNWPSASDGACGRYCTETGGLSILSKRGFVWNSSSTHTQHYRGSSLCGAVDCRAGKGFLRAEVKDVGGMHATNLQVYVTHAQANYQTDPCGVLEPFSSCGRWYEVRERQMRQMAGHAGQYVGDGDGPILYLGDLNVPARDFAAENVHRFFSVYDEGGEAEYDRLLGILDQSGTGRGIRDSYREAHPPDDDSVDPEEMLPYFTSNPTLNHLAEPPWHGRIDYQLVDDSRSCYRLEPLSAEHVDLRYPGCNTGPGDSLSDHFAVGVRYDVYRKIDRRCNLVNPPPTLDPPVPRVFPPPYGSGMSLSWSEPSSPGTELYEIQFSTNGGATWQVYTDSRSASYGPWINHHGTLACGDGYFCLESNKRYDYRVRGLDGARAPLTPWSKVAGATSLD